MKRLAFSVAAAALTLLVTDAPVIAYEPVPVAAPEISGASLSAGLGLLGAGVLWLRARRGAK